MLLKLKMNPDICSPLSSLTGPTLKSRRVVARKMPVHSCGSSLFLADLVVDLFVEASAFKMFFVSIFGCSHRSVASVLADWKTSEHV